MEHSLLNLIKQLINFLILNDEGKFSNLRLLNYCNFNKTLHMNKQHVKFIFNLSCILDNIQEQDFYSLIIISFYLMVKYPYAVFFQLH